MTIFEAILTKSAGSLNLNLKKRPSSLEKSQWLFNLHTNTERNQYFLNKRSESVYFLISLIHTSTKRESIKIKKYIYCKQKPHVQN